MLTFLAIKDRKKILTSNLKNYSYLINQPKYYM